jgi:hypothetical protein
VEKWLVDKGFQGKTLIEKPRKCFSKNIVLVFLLSDTMLENVVTWLSSMIQ